jgi:hypothetical protein
MTTPCKYCGDTSRECPCNERCEECGEVEACCRCIPLCDECGFVIVPQLDLHQPCRGLRCVRLARRNGKWVEVVG